MSYFENQANEARRDLSSIEMNGGIGSSAYYDAQNRYNEARRNQAWHDPKPSNPFGTWSAPNTLPSGGAGAMAIMTNSWTCRRPPSTCPA